MSFGRRPVAHRVLYVASDRPLPAARASLVASDAAAGSAITAGQLVLRGFTDVHGETGDLAAAATALRTIAGRARAAPQLRRLAGVLEWRHPQLTIEPAAR